MLAAGQARQDPAAVGAIGGFADDITVERNRRIGGEDEARRAARRERRGGLLGLVAGDAADIVGGRLAGPAGFVDVDRKNLEFDADLVQ